MQALSAKDVKYGFGRLIALDRAEPVAKQGRPVVVVMEIEEYERLKAFDTRPTGRCGRRTLRR